MLSNGVAPVGFSARSLHTTHHIQQQAGFHGFSTSAATAPASEESEPESEPEPEVLTPEQEQVGQW